MLRGHATSISQHTHSILAKQPSKKISNFALRPAAIPKIPLR